MSGHSGRYTNWTAVSDLQYLESGEIGGRSGHHGILDSTI